MSSSRRDSDDESSAGGESGRRRGLVGMATRGACNTAGGSSDREDDTQQHSNNDSNTNDTDIEIEIESEKRLLLNVEIKCESERQMRLAQEYYHFRDNVFHFLPLTLLTMVSGVFAFVGSSNFFDSKTNQYFSLFVGICTTGCFSCHSKLCQE